MTAAATLQIRTFERADADAVVALWQRCGLTRPWNDPHKDIERKLQVQPELFLVGTLAAQVAASAMAGYDGHRGALYYLAVEPEHHGRGLGRAMMDAVCARLLALGCPKLNLMVRGDNAIATAFYERLDFDRQDVVTYGLRLIPDPAPDSK